jgi:membrane-bound lytic murein transglycosylase F
LHAIAFLTWLWPVACDAPPAEPAPVAVVEDPDVVEVPAVEPPAPELRVDKGDLERIRESGALRVLVFGEGEIVLPRDGASSLGDRELAAEFAAELGLALEPVHVAKYGDLVPMLLEGKGDLIAARMARTPERTARVAFSRPTSTVEELLVAKRDAPNLPASIDDLAGITITVRRESSYRETLEALAAGGKGPQITFAAEDRDTESLVHDVGTGAIAYTLCDSDLFHHIQAYNPDVVAVLPVATGRNIGWALRPDNPALKAAADAFLVSRTLTTHARARDTGDLEAIRGRGALRVLTRNNASSYFLHKGEQHGFDYELTKRFAAEQGLRLDVVVPPSADLLLPWLLEGRGDVIAAELTVTPERQAQIAFSTPYLFVDEVVVQRVGAPPITSAADLRGKHIAVRPSSSYATTLAALQAEHGPFTVDNVPEDVDSEMIVEQVARGELPMTVVDSTVVSIAVAHGVELQVGAVLAAQRPIAFGVRPGNPELLAALNAYVAKNYRGLEYNVTKKRYFEDLRVGPESVATARGGAISDFDPLLRRRSAEYGLDWRLMAAQAFQESRFDPTAKSWSGALGLFQVMPRTGAEMGFEDLHDPDQGVHAGVQYVSRLIDRFEPELPFKQRLRFALASYNVGKGHVDDARRLAPEMGLDPDKWFGNVEVAMLELRKPAVARRTKYGYCRAEEPVRYVSQIQTRYENYIAVVPDLN